MDLLKAGSGVLWLPQHLIFTKKKRLYQNEAELSYLPEGIVNEEEVSSALVQAEIMVLVNKLPKGYRKVFNLNTIEG